VLAPCFQRPSPRRQQNKPQGDTRPCLSSAAGGGLVRGNRLVTFRSFDRRRVGGFFGFGQGNPAGLAPVPGGGGLGRTAARCSRALILAASSNKTSPPRFGWNRRLRAPRARTNGLGRWRYALLVRAHDGCILGSAVCLLLVPTTGLGVAANSHPKPCNISWKRASSFMQK
jgi:hypothetical protein